MSMTIHSDLEVRLRGRAEAEGELERLVIEGLNSGESVVGDDAFWDAMFHRLKDRQRSAG